MSDSIRKYLDDHKSHAKQLKKRRHKKFKPRCVFDSFCHCFLIKFLKRYLVSGFIASNYESRVLIDPC